MLVLNSSDDEYLSGPESELSFSSEEEDSADGEEDETEDEESGIKWGGGGRVGELLIALVVSVRERVCAAVFESKRRVNTVCC